MPCNIRSIYICSRVPWYGPPVALARGLGPSIRLCKTTSHPFPLYFLIIVESPIGFSTCKDCDPYQPSITLTHSHHTSTGKRGTDHDHDRGGV